MKKLPNIGLEKILLFCGFSLALTMAGFWHHRQNVGNAEHLATFQQGVSTCFARVTQTFTAAMIRDSRSPYLNKDFMSLSDECLRDGARTSGIELAAMPKASRINNDLVSEVYWFHEKVGKVIGANLLNSKDTVSLNGISEKYAKIEGMKMDLVDQIDMGLGQAREARLQDEFLMGGAFCLFMAALSILAMRRVRSMRALREIERQALSLLNTGNVNVGAMVDQLLGRAMAAAEMPVTLRVFRDYHGEVMEHMASRPVSRAPMKTETEIAPVVEMVPEAEATDYVMPTQFAETLATPSATIEMAEEIDAAAPAGTDIRRLLVNQATRLNLGMDVQDGMVLADEEVAAQIIQAMGQRYAGWTARLEGKSHENLYTVRILADGACLNSSELEYASRVGARMDGVDLNVMMAVDMAREEGLYFHASNRMGNDGSIIGSETVLELPMIPQRNLKTVIRGKKRELEKQLRNTMN